MNKIITNSAGISTGISNGRPFQVHDEQAAKRQRILDAALKLFAHEPYQAVTMDRVAEAAGVAKGTLYLYFPSKDALYLGVLNDGLDTAYRTYQGSAVSEISRELGNLILRSLGADPSLASRPVHPQ